LLRVLRDDGAVVYLNGIEVFRSNMPTEPFFTTLASTAVGGAEESAFFERHPVELLHNGTNVVAVEVHQAGPTSSDVSFALELLAERLSAPVIVAPPTNQIVSLGSTANFAVSALGTLPLRYQWLFNGTNVLLGKTNSLLVLSNVTTELEGNYSVLVSNALGSVLSPEAALFVSLSNSPPAVTLVSPADGGVFEANVDPILLEAVASDPDGVVVKVSFRADDMALGEDASSPFEFDWLKRPWEFIS
jgi:hypothetical protein